MRRVVGGKKGIPKQMLFSLDGKDFAESWNKLLKGDAATASIGRSFAIFDASKGTSRMTRAMSELAIGHIRLCIDEPGRIQKYTDWGKPDTDEWQSIRRRFGYGTDWKFTGSVYENIGVIWRGRHVQTIGIRRDVKVPRSIDSSEMISVALYAKFLEYGTKKKDPKAIFRPAIKDFALTRWPDLQSEINKMFLIAGRKVTEYMKKGDADGSIADTVSQSSRGMSSNSVATVAGKNVEKAFKSRAASFTDASSIGESKVGPDWSERKAMTTILRKGGKATRGIPAENLAEIMKIVNERT